MRNDHLNIFCTKTNNATTSGDKNNLLKMNVN